LKGFSLKKKKLLFFIDDLILRGKTLCFKEKFYRFFSEIEDPAFRTGASRFFIAESSAKKTKKTTLREIFRFMYVAVLTSRLSRL
jgi:hypothetical protein